MINKFLTTNSLKNLLNLHRKVVLQYRMVTILRHIVSYVSVVLIVAATGGIGLVQHYCSCEDDARVVMASPSQDHDAGICCETEPVVAKDACCSSETEEDSGEEGHTCHSGHGCCSEHYTFFKTDQFNLIGSKVDISKIYTAKVVQVCTMEPVSMPAIQTPTMISDRSPPDLYGISLLIRIHQLKTDPLMS